MSDEKQFTVRDYPAWREAMEPDGGRIFETGRYDVSWPVREIEPVTPVMVAVSAVERHAAMEKRIEILERLVKAQGDLLACYRTGNLRKGAAEADRVFQAETDLDAWDEQYGE